MRRSRILLVGSAITVAVVFAGVGVATATSTGSTTCAIVWGSLPKSAPDLVPAPLTGVRTGRHECFDRLVIDLGGAPAPGYFVHYTDGLHQPGSGDPLAVAGGAVLTVTVLAPSYNSAGQSTVAWRSGDHLLGGATTTFRDLVFAGSFEGESTFGLGVRARLPFRVLKLDGPGAGSRLVIDVAHRW